MNECQEFHCVMLMCTIPLDMARHTREKVFAIQIDGARQARTPLLT